MDQVCNWTPQLIISLLNVISWPLIVIIFLLIFKFRIPVFFKDFLSKISLTEISASPSGVTAKFTAPIQTDSKSLSAGLPEHMQFDAIVDYHENNRTELSDQLYSSLKSHSDALDIDDKSRIDLLLKELSIQQSHFRYFEINKVLFRSQYDLLLVIKESNFYISKEIALKHYISVKNAHKEVFSEWDFIKYVSYPVSVGLIASQNEGFILTMLGKSYLKFMAKNPQIVEQLSKL